MRENKEWIVKTQYVSDEGTERMSVEELTEWVQYLEKKYCFIDMRTDEKYVTISVRVFNEGL